MRPALVVLVGGLLAFGPGVVETAYGGRYGTDAVVLDPAASKKLQVALAKLKESAVEIGAVEAVLAGNESVVATVGGNSFLGSSDPVRNEALRWIQTLQPEETLVVCLEKGSNLAVVWALKQVVWHNGGGAWDDRSRARLMPGLRKALAARQPATRAEAVAAMMVCLPQKKLAGFLKGMFKGQPDEVIAEAIALHANFMRESDAQAEVIVRRWLKESEDPNLLHAACTYWWLVKSRVSSPAVEEEEIAAFERLATHANATVRSAVTSAVEAVATPARPRLVGVLLRLTHDGDATVRWRATRALRYATTPEVAARLQELCAGGEVELRSAAVEVLGFFGGENVPLIVSLATTDKAPSVRQWAVYSLRKIGTAEAGRGLEVASSDADSGVREEAKTQLEWLRKEQAAKK